MVLLQLNCTVDEISSIFVEIASLKPCISLYKRFDLGKMFFSHLPSTWAKVQHKYSVSHYFKVIEIRTYIGYFATQSS